MSREMKDSGIPWIGVIPKDWKVNLIGNLYTLRNEKVSDKEYKPLSVTKQGIVPQLETAAKTNDNDNRKLVRIGDFAINSRSDRRGSCGISKYDGSVSLINTIISPRDTMIPQFYNWLFHTELFADEFYKWGHGIVDDLWTTGWNEMKRISIVVPSLNEQKAIAEFLDRKCGEIDELVVLQDKMIEELKAYKQSIITETVTKGLNPNVLLKDSGIQWIGEIPQHWEISKIKYIGEARNGLTYSPQDMCDETKGTLVLRSSNIQNDNLCFEDNVYVDKEIDEELMMREGDILICSRNGSAKLVGKCAMIPKNVNATFGAFMMRFRSILDRKFSLYLIRTTLAQYKEFFSTSTINQLTNTMIGNMQFPLPSEHEQHEIADFLDKKCSEIGNLIELKQQKIEELKEYKKSIIYEYVTGKKEVSA